MEDKFGKGQAKERWVHFTEFIENWQNKWNLNAGWCASHALGTLINWVSFPETVNERFPHFDALITDPHTNEALELQLDLKERLNLNAYDVPEEMQFRMQVEEGWKIHLWEKWPEAKERIKKEFTRSLAQYKKNIEEMTKDWERFRPVHFEWLVRRVIPPTKTCEDIGNDCDPMVDTALINRETRRLAAFLDLEIKKITTGSKNKFRNLLK